MSKGARFDSALAKTFASRLPNVDALEKEFRPYAISQFVQGAR